MTDEPVQTALNHSYSVEQVPLARYAANLRRTRLSPTPLLNAGWGNSMNVSSDSPNSIPSIYGEASTGTQLSSEYYGEQ